MAIKDIVQKDVVAIEAKRSLKNAAKLMRENHVGAVVVVDERNGGKNTPIGIITDRDIALSLTHDGKFDPDSSVRTIMSSSVILGSPEDGIYETIEKMRSNGIRRMPVVDKNDQLVGIIAVDDLIQLLGSELNDLSQTFSLASKNEAIITKSEKQRNPIRVPIDTVM